MSSFPSGAVVDKRAAREHLKSDTEVIVHLIALSHENSTLERLISALRRVEGSYSLLLLTDKEMIAVRDPMGIRPLCIGQMPNSDGYVVLSKEKADKAKVWEELAKIFENDGIVEGRVIERVKGGLAVDIGVRAFLPGSLADIRPLKNLDVLRGRELEFRIVSFDKKRGNIVLSRKALMEEVAEAKKAEAAQALADGRTLHGVVKNLTEYGAFVDLGGIDGLIHVSEIAWERVAHPKDILRVGQELQVSVISVEPSKRRIQLSLKRLRPDPWATAAQRYQIGQIIEGVITNVTDFGAFAKVDEGLEGLVHTSELTDGSAMDPRVVVREGDHVQARILSIDGARRRLALSLKLAAND